MEFFLLRLALRIIVGAFGVAGDADCVTTVGSEAVRGRVVL